MPSFLRGVVVDAAPGCARPAASDRKRPEPSGPAGAAAGQGRQAVGGVGRPPAADGFVADAQQVGEFDLGVAQFDAPQGAQAQHLKGFIGQLAGVGQLDGHVPPPNSTPLMQLRSHKILSKLHAGVIWHPFTRKKNSPFWFIQFIDADGTRRNKSTGLRTDNPGETVKARALRAQLEAKELNRNAGEISGGGWDTWVPQYLERHCESPRTLERYTGNWKWLAFWLQEKHYHSPRAITYRNALEYIDWRTNYKKKTGKTVGRNTAIMELKLLAMIMGEAVRLGHADANPLVSLKLRRDKAAKKPELTDKEISEIREALKDEPEWMQTAFDISLHTGCRLRETRLPLNCLISKRTKSRSRRPKAAKIGRSPFRCRPRCVRCLNASARPSRNSRSNFRSSRRAGGSNSSSRSKSRICVFTACASPTSIVCAAPVCRVKRPCGW